MVNVVAFVAPFLAPAVGTGAANICGCFGNGTTNVTSWLIFIRVIAPKNAIVPAKNGLSAAAPLTSPGAPTRTSKERPLDAGPGCGSVTCAMSGRGIWSLRWASIAALGTATDAVLPFAVPLARGAAFVDAT